MFDNKEKRKTTSLSDILRGLQQAVSSAVSALQAQQLNMLNDYIGHDGKPITKTVVIGGRTMEVPVMSLLSQSNIEMDDVEMTFKAKISDVADMGENGFLRSANGAEVSHATLMLNMSGVKSDADDTIEIKVHFKTTPIPEGVARLTDEYNKII